MSSRPRRSAAIKALEKIQKIAKEAEKYDDYGEEIEEIDGDFIITSVSEALKIEPITSANWSVQATNAARIAAAENVPKDVTSWPDDDAARTAFAARVAASKSTTTPSVSDKTTPDTLFGISSSSENLKYNAYQIYLNDFKQKHIENIKKYLTLSEDNNMRYIAIPELIKYLITNPSLIIHNSNFATTVLNKMIEFEKDIPTSKKIGSYIITEDYRKQLLSLIKILKKTSIMHSKLKTMANKEFYDNIETIAKDF
jgi:hypothetical protein